MKSLYPKKTKALYPKFDKAARAALHAQTGYAYHVLVSGSVYLDEDGDRCELIPASEVKSYLIGKGGPETDELVDEAEELIVNATAILIDFDYDDRGNRHSEYYYIFEPGAGRLV